jgi:hypothetical protein
MHAQDDHALTHSSLPSRKLNNATVDILRLRGPIGAAAGI